MAQHSNEHLTITKLSAYLDKELAPEELALCDAHIQICQPCRAALADLRLTSALLSSMPQVAVPRSFVLPTNLLILPETPTITGKATRRSSSLAPHIWRRTMSTASTLVAILGLFFFLAGALSSLSHGGGMATSSTASNGSTTSAPVTRAQSEATSTASVFAANTPAQHTSPDVKNTRQPTSVSQITPTPASTSQPPYDTSQHPGQPPAPQLPAALDLGQASGRLTIGGSLLLLGILGALATRLFDRSARR